MRKSKSPLTQALSDRVIPWAQQEKFTAYSPRLFVRERDDIGAKEIIEFQGSNRHPYRMYTVNLGLFHPDYCEDIPSDPKDLGSVHCGREVRIGHLMSKSPWFRLSIWWQYGKTRDEAIPPVNDTLRHLATVGLQWFRDLRRYPTAAQAFDPKGYAPYEMGGACTRGIDLRLKPV